jgi:hypothetical protein
VRNTHHMMQSIQKSILFKAHQTIYTESDNATNIIAAILIRSKTSSECLHILTLVPSAALTDIPYPFYGNVRININLLK